MKSQKLLTIVLMITTYLHAQTDSTKTVKPLQFSGFVDTYYSYDFGNPQNHLRPSFVDVYNRHNEVNLNLGFIRANYQTENVKAILTLATGTYMEANYAAEQGVLKNIYEAYTALKISKTKNAWIQIGVMPSHIGFETAYSPACWTLTRSIMSSASPFYQAGIQASYETDNGKWYFAGLVLNGWQHIQRPDGNQTPAFGHQITYKPNSKVTLNSSSFIGNDKPDVSKQMRYFHNLYGIFQLSDKWGLTAGFDIGAEQKSKGSEQYNCWYSPNLIARYQPTKKIALAGRVEYYSDKNGVIIPTGTPNGFQTYGYSTNFDYKINNNALVRIEARTYQSKDDIFLKNNVPTNANYFVTSSLAITF